MFNLYLFGILLTQLSKSKSEHRCFFFSRQYHSGKGHKSYPKNVHHIFGQGELNINVKMKVKMNMLRKIVRNTLV